MMEGQILDVQTGTVFIYFPIHVWMADNVLLILGCLRMFTKPRTTVSNWRVRRSLQSHNKSATHSPAVFVVETSMDIKPVSKV